MVELGSHTEREREALEEEDEIRRYQGAPVGELVKEPTVTMDHLYAHESGATGSVDRLHELKIKMAVEAYESRRPADIVMHHYWVKEAGDPEAIGEYFPTGEERGDGAVPAIRPEEALRLKREKEKLEAQAAKVEEEKKGLEEEKNGLKAEKFALEAVAKPKNAKRDWLQMANEQIQKELMEQQEKEREMQRRHDLELEEAQSFCVVCRTAKPSIHFQPCQHVCTCRPCWKRIQEQTKKGEFSRCPLCREQVGMWSGAYLS
eukprot:Skav227328  [mRNA]  locus=scaffold2964:60263:63452:- [translate_table: standard]